MEYLLTVENLRKTYPGQPGAAVESVTFRVEKGELLVVVGASGSGKTTLLKMLAGLEEPDAGTIRLAGELVTGPAHNLVPGHPDIKLVYQDYHLFPNHTVYQNLIQALKGYRKDYQTQRVEQLFALCALEPLRHKYPRELSGGEQQRVALARAMADEPAVLLLDEPFSNLDELTKQPLRRAISESVHTFGTAAVLVTHDNRDALALADRIAVMRGGHLLQLDTPQRIYRQPASPYVALFWGNANILTVAQLRRLVPFVRTEAADEAEVCIRAEDVRVCATAESQFAARVVSVRFAGAYEEAEVRTHSGIALTLHAGAGTFRVGETIPLRIDLSRVHFFDGYQAQQL